MSWSFCMLSLKDSGYTETCGSFKLADEFQRRRQPRSNRSPTQALRLPFRAATHAIGEHLLCCGVKHQADGRRTEWCLNGKATNADAQHAGACKQHSKKLAQSTAAQEHGNVRRLEELCTRTASSMFCSSSALLPARWSNPCLLLRKSPD